MGVLDLSGADLKGFDALDAGRYDAEVFAITMDAVKNISGEGKLPAGTPLMKVQFKILNPVIEGVAIEQDRRCFTQYAIPPKGYDPKKSATMNGMIARFFIATGDDEAKVLSKTFDPDFEDYIGRKVVVTLSKQQKYGTLPEDNEWDNSVKGVKAAGTATGTSSLL